MPASLESLVAQFGTRELPPVETWRPEKTSSIDITIDRAGDWHYNGSKIERKRMVSLFSTILWREDNTYYLVTPVEKLRIEVEDAPFVAVLMDVQGSEELQVLRFTDNTGNDFIADTDHPISLSESGHPYVIVRRNLPALLARAVFYQLTDLLQTHENKQGVWSAGTFFELA